MGAKSKGGEGGGRYGYGGGREGWGVVGSLSANQFIKVSGC